ncbi:MAG: DUF3592 domain-containing protein [Clostridia bacterium]|nr:DUF3592 domain-containing protein [Clostridia bacterium]
MNEQYDSSSSEDLSFGFSSGDNWQSSHASPIGSHPVANPLLGSYPANNSSPLGSYPANNNSPLGSYPANNNSPLGGYPANNSSPLGSYPANNSSPLGGYPANNSSPLGSYPANNNSPLGSYPANNNSPLGGYPANDSNSFGFAPAPTPSTPTPSAPMPSAPMPSAPTSSHSHVHAKNPARFLKYGILAWIAGSIALTVFLMKRMEFWVVYAGFLQLLAGLTVYFVALPKNRVKSMIKFWVVDALAIIALMILRWSIPSFFAWMNESLAMLLALLFFCGTGIAVPFYTWLAAYTVKRHCKVSVTAVCTHVETSVRQGGKHSGATVYCPVYEYDYMGVPVCVKGGKRRVSTRTGTKVHMLVNPENTRQFLILERFHKDMISSCISGAIFFAMGVFTVWHM